MKKLLLVTSCMMLGVHFAWADETMRFVAALSTPVASFNVVETKDNALITTLPDGAEVNIGSELSGKGTIRIERNAKEVEIDSLWLEDGTTLKGDTGWTQWMIKDSLTVGPEGNVQLGGIFVKQLKLMNSLSGKETNFTVYNILKITSDLKVKDVYITPSEEVASSENNVFRVGECTKNSDNKYNDNCFDFVCTEASCGEEGGASAQTLSRQILIEELPGKTTMLGSDEDVYINSYKYIFKSE